MYYDRDEVLKRPTLTLNENIDHKLFKAEGRHPENQFMDGNICYVPVSYKAQRFKMRVNIVNPRAV